MKTQTPPGYFGKFGGSFVPETLIPALDELEAAFASAWPTEEFQSRYRHLLNEYVGRPTPLTVAERLTAHYGGPTILFKREDLCHTGAHKINNAIGQVLLAEHMGKKRIIAETGAGQHGVATATVCARFGLECVVYMGAEDVERQHLNVERMKLLGAEVRPVTSGSQTLKDATNEAIRDWVTNVETTHYMIGSVVGPHPYPTIVRDFHRVIGDETRDQLQALAGRPTPDAIVACVGGGSNTMGIFHPFVNDKDVDLYGVEAAGHGLDKEHAATLAAGKPGILHGSLSYVIQDDDGQITIPHSISAGLDYPGIGPEHAHLRDIDRVVYGHATDEEALRAVKLVSQLEGIIPALETAHALAFLDQIARKYDSDKLVVVNMSGRGDKDMTTITSSDIHNL